MTPVYVDENGDQLNVSTLEEGKRYDITPTGRYWGDYLGGAHGLVTYAEYRVTLAAVQP